METWGESQVAVGDTVTATVTVVREHAPEYQGLRRRCDAPPPRRRFDVLLVSNVFCCVYLLVSLVLMVECRLKLALIRAACANRPFLLLINSMAW